MSLAFNERVLSWKGCCRLTVTPRATFSVLDPVPLAVPSSFLTPLFAHVCVCKCVCMCVCLLPGAPAGRGGPPLPECQDLAGWFPQGLKVGAQGVFVE